jgi:hypothetical protein
MGSFSKITDLPQICKLLFLLVFVLVLAKKWLGYILGNLNKTLLVTLFLLQLSDL